MCCLPRIRPNSPDVSAGADVQVECIELRVPADHLGRDRPGRSESRTYTARAHTQTHTHAHTHTHTGAHTIAQSQTKRKEVSACHRSRYISTCEAGSLRQILSSPYLSSRSTQTHTHSQQGDMRNEREGLRHRWRENVCTPTLAAIQNR